MPADGPWRIGGRAIHPTSGKYGILGSSYTGFCITLLA
jgi:hypothetical protein